jgi:inner membrane protein
LDTLTHALSGALVARATAPADAPRGAVPRRVAAGFLAAAAPDVDFLVGLAGPVEYLLTHRGVTHSVLLMPLWAFPIAWLLAKLLREPGGWRALYGVAVLAIATHIAGDLITSFGTMVFAPFSDWRAGLGTTFIIDLWFSAIILAGLVASAVFRRSRLPAAAASALLAGYVGFQAIQRHEALEFAERYARENHLSEARISAQPRPVSPFNWTVFVSDAESHRFAHINLVRKQARTVRPGDGFIARLDAGYRPLDMARWETRTRYGDGPALRAEAKEAWNSPELDFFRWFAELPALDGVTEGLACAWFVDLRFLTPGRERLPFRFGACREAPGAPWRAYEGVAGGGKRLLR